MKNRSEMNKLKVYVVVISICAIVVFGVIAGLGIRNTKIEYININPHEEKKPIFEVTVCISANYSFERDEWFERVDFTLLIGANYNFSEKALYMDFSALYTPFTYDQNITITINFVSIEIIKENYFIELEGYAFFGTLLRFTINEQLLNCTIQPLTFYKKVITR